VLDAWFNTLPADLQKIFVQTVNEIAARMRKEARAQEEQEIAKGKAAGLPFCAPRYPLALPVTASSSPCSS
jgi:TRAP-type C4-dicarboxylate transport system substrate-binding protein